MIPETDDVIDASVQREYAHVELDMFVCMMYYRKEGRRRASSGR